MLRELNGFEKRVRQQARQDKRVRLVMSAPCSDLIVGLTWQVAAIDASGQVQVVQAGGIRISA